MFVGLNVLQIRNVIEVEYVVVVYEIEGNVIFKVQACV